MDDNGKENLSDGVKTQYSGSGIMNNDKKQYVSPVLMHRKHLRDITLNPSPGLGESGAGIGNTLQPLGDGDSSTDKTSSSKGDGIWENDIFGE